MKRCGACGQTKEFQFFSKNSSTKDGIRARCKSCDQQYRKLNSKRIREYNNKYERAKYKNDPSFRLARKLRRSAERILQATKAVKTKSSFHYLGCSIEEFKLHIENQFTEGMTWENSGEWHLDHIIPLDYYVKNEDDPYKANHFSNFQPLWAKENIVKGNKYCP